MVLTGELVIVGVLDESLANKGAEGTERVLTVMEGTSAGRQCLDSDGASTGGLHRD